MNEFEKWPIDKADLQADWNQAMRGYKPNVFDPYKGEADRLRSLGLEPTARNNMLVQLLPWLLGAALIGVAVMLATLS